MKKHPVDDLFKGRLASMEKMPSEKVWERIQEGQKTKSRRAAAWVWYAAASVSLVLISGYVVWQNQTDVLQDSGKKASLARVETSVPASVKTQTASKAVEEASKTEGTDVPEVLNQGAETLAERTVSKTPAAEQPVSHAVTETTKNLQVAKIEQIKPTESNLERTEIPTAQLSEKVAPKSNALAYQEEKKPDRTIIVDVEEPQKEIKESGKKSRLARVFRQLKNVREAEPVDWEDVGFNPKNIIARADDRPNDHEGFSEKRERKN